MSERTLLTVDAVWAGDRFLGPTTLERAGERLLLTGDATDPAHSSDADRPSAPDHPSNPDHSPKPAHASDPDQPDPAHPAQTIHLGGTLFPSLTDHHVHLGLTDATALFAGGITHAADLGWVPSVSATWLADEPGRPQTTIAGGFITAPDGYPARAGWAPSGSALGVGGARAARVAVREQVMLGASRIKVTLNTDAGETVDNSTLDAIVEEASASGVPVVAHVQGPGQTARAIRAGVAQLAHTPFSERVEERLIALAVDARMSWITTLDIHGWGAPTPERATAIENLRRFAAAGGEVLYGTDLGNGPLPVGVNTRELRGMREAGMPPAAILRAIAGSTRPSTIGPRFAWLPTAPPADLDAELADWLAHARGKDLRTPATADRPTSALPHPHPRPQPASKETDR